MNHIKLIFSILVIILSHLEINSQCPTGAFYGQSDIDNFIINYPNCDSLLSFSINEQYHPKTNEVMDTVYNLDGFRNVKYIDDFSYKLSSLIGLKNISGLDSVETIDGDIRIRDAGVISNFNGFKGLKRVNTDIVIELTNFDTISGFGAIEEIGRGLSIQHNDKLKYVADLGSFDQVDYAVIFNNSELNDIYFLNSLSNINRHFQIKNNDKIINFNGLNKLEKARSITIRENPSLLSIAELSSFTSLTSEQSSSIIIDKNLKLSSTIGLDNMDMSTITELTITENPNLQFCNSLNFCEFLSSPFNSATVIGNHGDCATRQIIVDNCEDGFNIAPGTLNECSEINEIKISSSEDNHEMLIHIKDFENNILCSINAMGNNLGNTKFELYHSSETRIESRPYANKDISIIPEFQPTTPVFIRLYYTSDDFDTLAGSDESIETIQDVFLSRTENNCTGILIEDSNKLDPFSIGELDSKKNIYVDLYVNHFSTFYLHGDGDLLLNNQIVENLDLRLKSNLVTNQLILDEFKGNLSYDIYNSYGTILQSNDKLSSNVINLNFINTGFHFIRIENHNKRMVLKFIKM